MWLIRTALRHPISVIVALLSIALCSILAISRMPIDIFPRLNLPVIYVAPPFGGNQRTIVINVDPDRMREYGMSHEKVVKAVSSGNANVPSGIVRTEGLLRITSINSVVTNPQELRDLPIRSGAGPTVFLRDLGNVEDSTDILTSYAHFNGRRTVYIPVTKRADASTLEVVNGVKQNIPRLQAVIPNDIKMTFELDQSVYVRNALSSVLREALLGALLTGVAVLLFLRDWRSSLIVLGTIPFALLAAVVALWGAGQSINIMTLGGLALAVGILVDEATVAIENIHRHSAEQKTIARAMLDGSSEVIVPRLLAMLSILAVFIPSFFMKGVAQSLFVPLSLAVGFAMMASYFLASSFVPVLSVWILPTAGEGARAHDSAILVKMRDRLGRILDRLM